MAYKNIYEVLDQNICYERAKKEQQIFIDNIDKFSDKINDIDPKYGCTPITYYCINHKHSYMSPFVIEKLISYFRADVNKNSPGHGIPLNVLLSSLSDKNKDSKEYIESIRTVFRHTQKSLLIKKRDPISLFSDLVRHANMINSQQIQKTYYEIIHEIERSASDDLKSTTYQQLYKDLNNSLDLIPVLVKPHDEEKISQITQEYVSLIISLLKHIINKSNISKDQYGRKFFDQWQVFLFHLSNNNKYSGIIFQNLFADSDLITDNEDYNLLAKYINGEYKATKTKIEEEIAKYITYSFEIVSDTIVICDQVIEPSLVGYKDRPFDVNFNKKLDVIINKAKEISKREPDRMIREDEFGFKNNLFHLLALVTSTNKNTLDKVYRAYGSHYSIFTDKNLCGSTPLKLALLCGNTVSLEFFVDSIKPHQDYKLDPLDIHESGVGHILARSSLLKYQLEDILKILNKAGINLNSPNEIDRFKRTPAHDAVRTLNKNFIEIWDKNKNNFHMKDKNERTLWHEFSQTYTSNDGSGQFKYIFNLLKQHIKHLVEERDIYDRRPIEYALLSPLVFKWLLDPENGLKIDLTSKDKEGNTLSHIMDNNFIDKSNNDYMSYHKDIIKLLLPHRNVIKNNYNTPNNHGQLPINIIESHNGIPFPAFMNHKVSNAIFKTIACKYNQCMDIDTEFQTHSSSTGMIVHDTKDQYKDDNNFLFVSEKILTDINDIKKLETPAVVNIIHRLLFDIVYTNINKDEDNLFTYLSNANVLEINRDITLPLILEEIKKIEPELIVEIYKKKNRLGQSLFDLAIQHNNDRIFQYGLENVKDIKEDIINEPIKIKKSNDLWDKLSRLVIKNT